jgi:hypothetical protein
VVTKKRQAWCIEDAAGECLRHLSSLQGTAPDKNAAVTLAEAMIRDGRMPSPEEAHQLRQKARQTATWGVKGKQREGCALMKKAAGFGITMRAIRRSNRHRGWLRSNFIARERQQADHRPITESIWEMSDKAS